MRISILVPTRKRPENIVRLWKSIMDTADKPEDIEFVYYTDSDDTSYDDVIMKDSVRIIESRKTISAAWNRCADECSGEILGLFGDDVVFTTKGWDTIVKDAFTVYEDRITYVFGNDGTERGKLFGTHGFIHKNWTNTVGYFVAPYFSADQVDRWLNVVSEKLGRRQYVPIDTEHLHYGFGKAEFDETYREARAKAGDNEVEWDRRQLELNEDVEKLRKFIDEY